MRYHVVLRPLGAPPCTLCAGVNDYGLEISAMHPTAHPSGTGPPVLMPGTTLYLCDECLHELMNIGFDELLRTGDTEDLGRKLDQLATRIHRHN